MRRGAGDEIGVLVDRYNRMAEKVRVSALALARSERESAWREMAMQVAHEIKNPLTPMKLGIQQLEKRARDEEQDADALRNRFVSLSGHACKARLTCWCALRMNSARWPGCHRGPGSAVSLRAMESVVELHDTAGHRIVVGDGGEVAIEADEDQLRRLLSNLILNAQQAIGDRGVK